jgi:malate dehydrogenase (quinone)
MRIVGSLTFRRGGVMRTAHDKTFDVVIVGAGVTGGADAFILSRFTNARKIAVIEKNARAGQVNSNPLNNSQTSHDGGTETNYSLGHARKVQYAAKLLRSYIEARGDPELFRKTNRMVLGVGPDERKLLKERFSDFRADYPDLRFVERDELARIEPKIIEGRDPSEDVCALVSSEGYAVNYQRLAESFLADAKIDNPAREVFLGTEVTKIKRDSDWYEVALSSGEVLRARVVMFAAGAYSLFFAQQLGYGKGLGILSVAGSFYSAGQLLKGKVYRVQIEGMPFAAIHGDPDVLGDHETRFGPTTKPLPLMERHQYKTFFDYLKLPTTSIRGLMAIARIIRRKHLFWYGVRNVIYDFPVIGPWAFMQEVKKIIPTIRYRDLKLRRGAGGVRPQIVNLTTGELEMGESTIYGENGDRLIFNTTPSPGASVCLANAVRDVRKCIEYLGSGYRFNEDLFESEFGGDAKRGTERTPKA